MIIRKIFFYVLRKLAISEDNRIEIYKVINEVTDNEYNDSEDISKSVSMINSNPLISSMIESEKEDGLRMISKTTDLSKDEVLEEIFDYYFKTKGINVDKK